MRKYGGIIAVCFALILLPQWVQAQGQLGALTGTIFDTSGAVVPGAEITITNMDTQVASSAKSSAAGLYRVPVRPGKYRVEARKEGFKASVATEIVVPVAQVVTIDMTLQVGTATQTVTVTTEAPLLTPSTAEVGASVTPQEFQTLPVIISDGGRQLDTFVWESMPGTTPEWANGASINGGQDSSHAYLIDGVTLGRYDNNNGLGEFQPGTDAIGEFKVQMANYSAEYGTTGGGLVNFSIKSGTNTFHGAGFEYVINPVFNANGLTNNAFGDEKATLRDNNFGGNIGGPIRKNKTFFFFNYEGDRKHQFSYTGLTTVPTPAMVGGDFSAWLPAGGNTVEGQDALGRDVYKWGIYDPTSTRVVPAGAPDPVTGLVNNSGADATIRDPFPNNQIPASMFSTATSSLLQYLPKPQYDTLTKNLPHYGGTCCPILNRDAYTVKIDQAFGNSNRLSGSFTSAERHRWMRNDQNVTWAPWPGQPLSSAKIQDTGGPQLRILDTWTLNDHTMNVLSLAYNRFLTANNQTDDNKYTAAMGIPGISDLCFPPMALSNSDHAALFGGTKGTMGVSCALRDPMESYIYMDTLTYTHSKHSLKFGGQYIRYRSNNYEPGNVSGSFGFSNLETSAPGFTSSTGHAFASWLLGAATSGSRSVYTTEPGYRAGLFSFFAQDDWRATSKLTLNIGLRWEIPQPKSEAYSRMSEFNPLTPNPTSDGGSIPGAIVWLGSCSTCVHRSSFQDWDFKNLSPRFGLAYQISPKMVFRGGYGISYQPPIENGWGPQTFWGFNDSVIRHRQGGALNKVNPVLYLSDFKGGTAPGPLGLPEYTGTLPNMDPTIANGQTADYYGPGNLALPYVQNWSAGIQYQLPHEVLIEANYVGAKGSRLYNKNFGGGFNQPLTKYLGLGDMLGDTLSDDLADPVASKTLAAYGITKLPYPTFDTDNYSNTVQAALSPYVQYSGLLNETPNMGSSTYHSAQFTVRKNSTHGLTFIAAYTISKNLSNSDSAMYNPTYIQDFYNRALEKSLTSFDYPQMLKLTWIYSLPFGKGQKWMSSPGKLNVLVSGWQFTAIQNYGSGDPLNISSSDSTYYTQTVRGDVISGVPQTVTPHGLDVQNYTTQYLNPAAFADPPTAGSGTATALGTASVFLPNVRGPAHQSEDFGLVKNTPINERVMLQLRADFQNVFNRTGLGNPDTCLCDGMPADGGTFGTISSPMNGPRTIQMGMHITF